MSKSFQPHLDFSLTALRRNYTDPYDLYAALREYDRIYFDPSARCWLITGLTEITAILNNPSFISHIGSSLGVQLPRLHQQMLFLDGEIHHKMYHMILQKFSHISKYIEQDMQKIVRRIFAACRSKEEIDVVNDIANPISLAIIATILGIPASDYDHLLEMQVWSDTFSNITSGYFSGKQQDITNLASYFEHLIFFKRQHLADDLLSALIQAEKLFASEEELITNCMMIFAAGTVTMKKLLGNGLPLLLEQWEQAQQLYKKLPETAGRLMGEELLRMVTPTRCLLRQASTDVDLTPFFPGNHLIKQGERLFLFLEAANYDPLRFSEPSQFRPLRHPNRHITFGYGSHQCPGSMLARLEVKVTLDMLLKEMSPARLLPKPGLSPVWNPNPNLGGFSTYPVVWLRQ